MKELIMHLLNIIAQFGYFGIALALMIEIIPSELVLAYGGFMISQGDLNLFGVLIAGIIGGVIAQVILFWIGSHGGRPFLDKYGKYLLLSDHHLALSERWFQKYGSGVIFFARFIPVVRHAISIPAGIAKMSMARFLTFTTLAIIPWSVLFILLGEKLGKNWDEIRTVTEPYIRWIVLLIIVGALVVIIRKYLQRFKP